jgi:hypothetical protein
MSTQDLTKLAQELSTYAKIIQDHLEANKISGLSLDKDALIDAPFDPSNLQIQGARSALIKTAKLIHDLALGPKELMLELTCNVLPPLFSILSYHPRISLTWMQDKI